MTFSIILPFLSLEDAREKVDAWKEEYNKRRPHGALGSIPSAEFAELAEIKQ
jgi:putative transposase